MHDYLRRGRAEGEKDKSYGNSDRWIKYRSMGVRPSRPNWLLSLEDLNGWREGACPLQMTAFWRVEGRGFFPEGMGQRKWSSLYKERVCCVQWWSDPQLKWEAGSEKCKYSLTHVDLVVMGNKRHNISHKLLSVGLQGDATQLLQARASVISFSLGGVSWIPLYLSRC